MSSDYSVVAIKFRSPASITEFGASSRRAKKQPVRLAITRQDFDKTNIKNMSDAQILLNSFEHAQEKSRKTMAGKLSSILPSLFMLSAAAMYGALKKGPLSSKLFTASATMFGFSIAGAICDKTDDVSDRVKTKLPELDNMERKHPTLAFAGDFALKSVLILGAFTALSGARVAFEKHFEPSAKALSKGLGSVAKRINSSKLGEQSAKLSEKFGKFIQKHPKISEFAAKHSNFAPIAFLLGWMGVESVVEGKLIENKFNIAAQRAMDLTFLREVANHMDTV